MQVNYLSIFKVPRVRGGGSFIGIPGHPWQSFHVDELKGDEKNLNINEIRSKTLASILENGLVDVDVLIEEAMPKAISMTESQRVKRRLDILIGEEGREGTLFNVISKLLKLALTNEEKKAPSPEKWLVKMALGSEFLQEGNTFSKSIWLHVVEKVARPLSSIISMLDFEAGLEHAQAHESSWRNQLFLFIANCDETVDLLGVKDSVANASQFPFSWALINLLDRLSNAKIQASLLDAIGEMRQVKAIHDVMEGTTAVMAAFAQDLLIKKLPGLSKVSASMLNLLVEKLIWIANSVHTERLANNLTSQRVNFVTIADLYQAWVNSAKRFKTVLDILQLSPEIEDDLLKSKNDERSAIFELDDKALFCALELLKPSDKLTLETFPDWELKFKKIGTILQGFQASEDVRDKWTRVCIVGLFLSFVWNQKTKKEVSEAVRKKALLLWAQMKKIDFTNSSRSFDSIVTIIKQTSGAAAEKMLNLKNAESCIICRDAFTDPVRLPCGHVGCLECISFFLGTTGDEKACPADKCGAKVPKDYKPESTKDCSRVLKEHAAFRKGLNTFFQKCLQSQVFKNGKLPHPEIIESLLNFVVFQNLRHKEQRTTKKLNVFEADDIDKFPVIRSFVLQLLLMADFNDAKDHLETFFYNAQTFHKGKSDVDLCLLMLYCFEDHLLIKKGSEAFALNWIEEFSGYAQWCSTSCYLCLSKFDVFRQSHVLEEVSVANLILASKLRLALHFVGLELGKILGRNGKIQPWMGMVRKALLKDKSESLKKYLVRVVAKFCRQELIGVWKRDKHLSDLLPDDIKASGMDNVRDFFLFISEHDASYRSIRNGVRADLLLGKVVEIPGLLQKHPYKTKKDIWDLALYFLLIVMKCPVKDFGIFDIVSHRDKELADTLKSNCEIGLNDGRKEFSPTEEALDALLWQARVTFRNKNSR